MKRFADALEPGIVARYENGQSRCNGGPASIKNAKTVVLVASVRFDQSTCTISQSIPHLLHYCTPCLANKLGDHGDEGVFFFAFLGDDDGAVGEKLEGAAGGGFINAADLGDGGDGDEFSRVAEGGDDALLLGGEAGEEVAKNELEGIIALRATAQVGEGVGDGGAVAAADLPTCQAVQVRSRVFPPVSVMRRRWLV